MHARENVCPGAPSYFTVAVINLFLGIFRAKKATLEKYIDDSDWDKNKQQ